MLYMPVNALLKQMDALHKLNEGWPEEKRINIGIGLKLRCYDSRKHGFNGTYELYSHGRQCKPRRPDLKEQISSTNQML